MEPDDPIPPVNLGEIKINNEVLATIAAVAALKVEGVVGLAGRQALTELWGRKEMEKGISVELGKDSSAAVNAEVNVEYGTDIYEAARLIQRRVKDSIEGMTGLTVSRVNVSIRGVILGEQQPKRAPAPSAPPVLNGAE